MADEIVEITPERRAELKKGLLYDYDETYVRQTILVEDRTLRESIDAATKYLENKGRKIRTVITQKAVIGISFVIGLSAGIYLTLAILYATNTEAMKTVLGF